MKSSVQARLDEESAAALATLERRLGLSSSEIVRASLRLMVKQYPAPGKKKFLGIGKFDSGIGDLATNKKHMEGFGLTRLQRLKLDEAEETR
jgi:hypothetical protein